YLEPGDGILSFARCRTEMKKCSHPCFGGVLCTYGGSRMDKVELRGREEIACATARSHWRLGNRLIALGILPSRDGHGAVVAIFSRLLTERLSEFFTASDVCGPVDSVCYRPATATERLLPD